MKSGAERKQPLACVPLIESLGKRPRPMSQKDSLIKFDIGAKLSAPLLNKKANFQEP